MKKRTLGVSFFLILIALLVGSMAYFAMVDVTVPQEEQELVLDNDQYIQ